MGKITGNEHALGLVRPGGLIEEGLTIRQRFAAMAMQGLLSCGDHNQPDLKGWDERASIAGYSVQMADALITELNKENV